MTVWFPEDDGKANLADYDSFVNGPPHNTFARMRRESPIEWTDWDQGRGFWNVTRFDDIWKLNSKYKLLSSAQGIRMEDQSYEEYLARRTFQETDPPEHTKTRIKVAGAFTRTVIYQYEEQIREICIDILDKVLPRNEFDATKEIARQLPMRMLGRIIGLPECDLEWLVSKGDELIANTDPEFTKHLLDKMDTDEFRMMPFNSPAGLELYEYAKKIMQEKEMEGDTEGILHMILKPAKDGSVISENEFRNFFCLLVAAGNDTTRYSIAAAIHAFSQQPELLEQLREGKKEVWETAPDEIIRWASPTMYFRRTACQDFEIHGKRIRKGDKVLYWFVSGNRDETVFDKPFRVDLYRSPNRHMAFGQGGPHVCLGIWLARLEVKILMQEFCKRVSKVELSGPVRFLRSNFIGGIKHLPVTIQLN